MTHPHSNFGEPPLFPPFIDITRLTPLMQAWIKELMYREIAQRNNGPPPKHLFLGLVSHRRILKELAMPNLFPDMSRCKYEGSEDFIFAAPIHRDPWDRLQGVSEIMPSGVRYLSLPGELFNLDHGITILLREPDDSDDRMLEAAAWLRITNNNRDRIYATPWYKSMELHDQLVKTIGAPRHLSVMFDLPKEKAK